MNRKKVLANTLLGIGFLVGAFLSVQDSDQVHLPLFVPCLVLMLVGMLILQFGIEEEPNQHSKVQAELGVLRTSLETLNTRLESLVHDTATMNVYDVHHRIDADLAEDLQRFVNAREAMIPKLGMDGFADIMTSFSVGERLINRGWCASADGYIDEVKACLRDAQQEMLRTDRRLTELGV